MPWRLRVRHTTSYVYSDVVHASYNEARISPLDTPSQFTLEHRVDVTPVTNLYRYRDYWGSRVHAFDLLHAHTELTVVGAVYEFSRDDELCGGGVGVSLSDRSAHIDVTWSGERDRRPGADGPVR